ncbi:UNVERIFIED_CONTAM: hypothetical protein GTU68_014653 [Idotea baltica]|nr:hypothetical protein [Idotea baltica]
MSGRDLMGCAQTGSGKTAAFLLPILHYVLDPVKPTALIMSPTRELAIQIFNEARKFAIGAVVKVCLVYGGTSVSYQHKGLQASTNILYFLTIYQCLNS